MQIEGNGEDANDGGERGASHAPEVEESLLGAVIVDV